LLGALWLLRTLLRVPFTSRGAAMQNLKAAVWGLGGSAREQSNVILQVPPPRAPVCIYFSPGAFSSPPYQRLDFRMRAAACLVVALACWIARVSSFTPAQTGLLSLGPYARHYLRREALSESRAHVKQSELRPSPVARRGHAATDRGVADTSVDAEAFKVFLAREGFECQHLQLAYFGKLRGVMATEHISPGDTLLAFPALASTFNLASSRTCPCPELVASDFWEESESWTLKMALWLVAEKIKGSASRFAGKHF
jgi:hypothetical protein